MAPPHFRFRPDPLLGIGGPIKPGLGADIIAVDGDPLADIDTLRKVSFVMMDGKVFKQKGVAAPTKF